MFRPTWVEISKRAFSDNVRLLKKLVGQKTQLLAVLKADAYGHGANELASEAIKSGAYGIGVSSLEEGLTLRRNGLSAPILILGGIFPLKNFDVAFNSNLTPTVASFAAATYLKKVAEMSGRAAGFHLKVDTGMGRIGVSPSEAERLLEWVSRQPALSLEGVYSHFSCADSSASFTNKQISIFKKVQTLTKNLGLGDAMFHIANSAGILKYKKSFLDMVRPGLALYGISPFIKHKHPKISPVLSWHTQVIFLKKVSKGFPVSYGATFRTKRPSFIATLPVGYADGVPRLVGNKGMVLINGKRCPIVGRVTMDHIMVDVTDKNVSIGDKVTLIGAQDKSYLSVDAWARWANTISYEIVCGISKRVPRVWN